MYASWDRRPRRHYTQERALARVCFGFDSLYNALRKRPFRSSGSEGAKRAVVMHANRGEKARGRNRVIVDERLYIYTFFLFGR